MIHFLKSLVTTKMGWLYISFFFIILFSILSNYYEWANIAVFISAIYPMGFVLVAIGFGIFNHIKDLKK